MDFFEIDPLHVVMAVAAVVIVPLLLRRRNRHLKDLSRFADENGFEFVAAKKLGGPGESRWKYTVDGRHDGVWFRQYAAFYPFDTDRAQRVWAQLVKKEDGATWRAFRLTVASGGEGSSDQYWICTVELPMDLPALQVRPVGFKDKLAGLFGRRDVQTGSGEFDERFHVSGEDEAFARDFLDSGMKRFLMEDMTFRWQVRGPHAMLVWPHSFDVKDVEMMLFALKRFVEAIPAAVMR